MRTSFRAVDAEVGRLQAFAIIHVLLLLSATKMDAQGYYPLQIGNRWEYWENQYAFTVRATHDTLMPNGETYMVLGGETSAFLRQSGSLVLEYNTFWQREVPLYDFSKTTGDTVYFTQTDAETTIVTVLYNQPENMFGQQRRQWGFLLRELPRTFYLLREVTDSIGLTEVQAEPGMFLWLAGCVINGVQYGTISKVLNDPSSEPSAFTLHQNYPNPFNPSTAIRYELPRRAHVVLKIFNLLGDEVAMLVDEEKEAGGYKVKWNADRFASGMYLYRLYASRFIQTKRMLLIR